MSPAMRNNEDDCRKAFLSRVPTTLDEDSLHKVLQTEFGEDSISNVSTVKGKAENDDNEDVEKPKRTNIDDPEPLHKGFAFVTFSTVDARDIAISKGSFRWNENGGENSKKKKKLRTIYIGPIVRDASPKEDSGTQSNTTGICYLWTLGRCTHGDNCKFAHVGEGSCAKNCNNGKKQLSYGEKMKKRKCFSFKKTGKCRAGDNCPYSHDCFKPKSAQCDVIKSDEDGVKVVKDCINWKTKGKCRKGEQCPYRHDPALREKAIQKKERKKLESDMKGKKRKGFGDEQKSRQPLSIRVFGLNYDTSEQKVREYFAECGPIVELSFPKFEDSGRSKGFCGVLFQSPKAVEKAVALDGLELEGRWLRIQAGKMYLRQWEENIAKVEKEKGQVFGEFGQKVKRRKRHGFGE